MEYDKIKELSNKELHNVLRDERAQLQKLKFSHAVSQIENPGKIRFSRRLVAKYLTEISRRKNEELNKVN
jgi:large subunit ribosomal protein L29